MRTVDEVNKIHGAIIDTLFSERALYLDKAEKREADMEEEIEFGANKYQVWAGKVRLLLTLAKEIRIIDKKMLDQFKDWVKEITEMKEEEEQYAVRIEELQELIGVAEKSNKDKDIRIKNYKKKIMEVWDTIYLKKKLTDKFLVEYLDERTSDMDLVSKLKFAGGIKGRWPDNAGIIQAYIDKCKEQDTLAGKENEEKTI